ncbi:MAG: hypothetical protein ACKVOL_02160 [Novosphingobium sp.]
MSENENTRPAPSGGESAIGAVKGLVEEHPVAMLAGGILLGALVAGALSRPDKDAPAKGSSEGKPDAKPRRNFARRAVQLATLGAELAAAYAAGADSVAEEAPKPASPGAAEAPKPPARRISGLAASALRTLGPVLTRRLGRK